METTHFSWDIFISHATEDKLTIARPLALALRRKGLRVWYDEFALRLGDSLRDSIDKGLKESRFGIVIFSPHFFAKRWTEVELNGLAARQMSGTDKKKVILPIWHNVTHNDVLSYSPMLSDLVAISTELPLAEIAERILNDVGIYPQNVNLSKVLPTGIPRLDRLLGGGLPRPSSIALEGPMGIGKTTLGLQIQMAALDRGEPCLYITYREPPHDILNYMQRLGAPVEEYVNAGIFKVLDNFSAPNGLQENEVNLAIRQELQSAIIRVEDPTDQDAYYKMQVELMESMGMGGVNIIDSVNERYEMLHTGTSSQRKVSKYFQRFRARLARIGGQSAVHIAMTNDNEEEFNKLLGSIEDGFVRMRYEETETGRRRSIRVEAIRGTHHDDRWFEFIITNNGIEIF